MNKFYVYGYFREDGTPYYIGKGCGERAWRRQKRVKPPVDQSRIRILADGLSEEEAFEWEADLISLLGRKDNGTGCLRNQTDGGEGVSGRVMTEDSRKKLSQSCKGRSYGPLSEDHKDKISKALQGRKVTDEFRKKMSRIRRGSSLGPMPSQHKQAIADSLKKHCLWFHEVYGWEWASSSELSSMHNNPRQDTLSKVRNGKANHSKGWRVVS